MLRIVKSRSANAAKAYFREALQSADYYLEDREVVGKWCGLGSARLALVGDVTQQEFTALLDNRTPKGEKLTPRDRAERIPGFDFTINAPKSVSLLWAISEDERIVDAHKRAVTAMMVEVERNMEVRVRKGRHANSQATRRVGNAIWAEFLHDTARPVDGMPDPHLHSHCYVINAAYDDVEEKFKAAEIGNIAADRVYYEAVYHAALAREMKKLGFEIERQGHWWDVAGISRALIEKFSRRTAEVEAAAAAEGSLSADQKGELGKRTRSRKTEPLAYEDLHSSWKTRLSPTERREIDGILRLAGEGPGGRQVGVVQAWTYALDNALERHSVASEKRVLTEALRFGYGDVTLSELHAASGMTSLVRGEIAGRSVITTKDVLAEEERMIQLARKGRLACQALGHGDYQIAKAFLNDNQKAAIRHVWTCPDRVIMLRGGAGVGKTTGVLAEAVAGIEAAGHHVAAFAPTGAAVDELRQDVVSEANTVAALLVNQSLWEPLRSSVVVIDEASLLGVRDMAKVLDLAERYDWRVVLCGDEKQHGSVDRGDAFRLLRERAGVHTAEVREIVRQKGAYRDAVAAVERGDIDEGWQRFEQLGAVIETSQSNIAANVAADYIGELDAGRKVLVVAPTHAEKDRVTAKIRDGLRQTDRLEKNETSVLRLIDTRWTEAERGLSARYHPGLHVKFFQNAPSIMKGERLEVTGFEGGRPVLSNGHYLPLDRAKDFRVYEPRRLSLAVGDLLRITEQGRTEDGQKLRTGSVHRIAGFDTSGTIILGSNSRIPANYGHLDYGYCSTSHASQGRTVDTVLAAMGSQSLPATSLEQFYVTVSRGKTSARIYTDDAEAVRAATRLTSHRGSAMELLDNQVDVKLKPKRQERLTSYANTLARHATRLAKERGRELTFDADLMREAKLMAAAEHQGHAEQRSAEIGD